MEKYLEPLFWFYIFTGLVWIYRARLALDSIRRMPVIPAVSGAGGSLKNQPPVTLILPARNEEKNIGPCAESLLKQNYPSLEILIVNNASTDRTEEILQSLGVPCLRSQNETRLPITATKNIAYLNTPPTPAGWTGKNFAIVTALKHAQGEWLLFTDADTRHEPHAVTSVVQYAGERDLDFLTLLPRSITEGFWEHMVQPLAMGLIGLWFPIHKINDPRSKTSFANGQFLLIKKSLYRRIGGHDSVKGEFLEDFALMKKARERKGRYQCALGCDVYGTRMYDSLNAIWNGWRRIFLHAFGRKPGVLFAKFLSVLIFFVFPFFLFCALTPLALQFPGRYGLTWGLSIPVLILITGVTWKAFGVVRGRRIYSLLHPLSALLMAFILLDAFWMAAFKRETQWR